MDVLLIWMMLFTQARDEHLGQLRVVFQKLAEANLTINKCEFGQATEVYLGKIVGRGQVKPVNAKIEAILCFPVPSFSHELQHVLGMVGYYRSI